MRYGFPLLWLAGFALVGVLSVVPTFFASGEAYQEASSMVLSTPTAVSIGVPFIFFAAVYGLFKRFIGVEEKPRLAILHLALTVLGAVLLLAQSLALAAFGLQGLSLVSWAPNVGYACMLLSGVAFLAVVFEALKRRRRRSPSPLGGEGLRQK